MSEVMIQDSDAAVLETPESSQLAAEVDDQAHLSVEDALEIRSMLEEAARAPEGMEYGRTYWMEPVGPRVKLGAAGVRSEVQIDTGRQAAVRVRRPLGKVGIAASLSRQPQLSAR